MTMYNLHCMKDSRIGETLWSEWDGNDYDFYPLFDTVFYTETHVDIDNEIVRRALASTIQRDGHTDSLSQAFKVLDSCSVEHGHAGILDGDTVLTSCDVNGMTKYEDIVEKVVPITWVSVNVR